MQATRSDAMPQAAPPAVAGDFRTQGAVWLSLAAIFVGAMAIQVRLGVNTDPLWLMDLCGRLLDGQTAYVDFLENNPPFAILVYMPPVLAARWLGLPRDGAFIGYVALLALASLWASASILRAARRHPPIGSLPLLTAAAVLLALPDYAYGQRDHIDLILAAPWLACMGARASGDDPPRAFAVAAGLAAGLIFAIKPHYALSFVFVVVFVARRRGVRAVATFDETTAAVGSGLVFALASVLLFPAFFTKMAPMALEVYARSRTSTLILLVNPSIVASALLAAALFTYRAQLRKQPVAEAAVAAAAAGPVSYLIQGKWFAYHNYPCVGLLLIAFAMVARPPFSTLAANVGAAVAAVALGLLSLSYVRDTSQFVRETELFLAIAGVVFFAAAFPSLASMRKVVRALGIGCAVAALPLSWQGFHSDWTPRLLFLDDIKALGGRPSLAIVGSYGGLGIPAADAVGGRWGMSFIAWILTGSANQLLRSGKLSEDARAEVQKYQPVEFDRFVEDLKTRPADLIIFDETWARANLDAGQAQSILDGYAEISRAFATDLVFPKGLYVLFARKTSRYATGVMGDDPR